MTKPTSKTARFQHIAVVGSVLVMGSLVLATPVMAANPFSTFTSSLRQRLNRAYLMLPGSKSGEMVLSEASRAMENVTTARISLKTDANLKDASDKEVLSGSFSLAGPIEMTNVYQPKQSKQDLAFAGELSMQGIKVSASADLKIDGEVVYVNLKEIPSILPVKDLQNQWLKIDPAKMQATAEAGDMMEEESEPDKELSEEQKKQMQVAFEELLKNSNLSSARKETQGNHNLFVIDVDVKDEAVLAYFKKVAEIEGTPASELATQTTSLEESLAVVDDIKVTIWVDRSSYFIRQISMPLSLDVQKLLQMQEKAAEAQLLEAGISQKEIPSVLQAQKKTPTPFGSVEDFKKLDIQISAELDGFNEPITFTTPTDAQDFQEVLMKTMGGAMAAPAAARPTELPTLNAEEKRLLKEYGVEVENL